MKRKFHIAFKAASALTCISSVLLLLSCSPASVQQTGADEQGFSQSYAQGQLALHQRTDKKEISIAEQLELVLEASAPENTEVEFPRYSASLGDFTLKDSRTVPARMTGAGDNVRVVHQAVYLLEPYLSGTYAIPAMTVTYRDRKSGQDASQLVTEKIEVTVRSLLEPDGDRAAIKDIKPPLSLPPDRVQQFLVVGLLLILAALAVSGFFYWKKISARKVSPEILLRPEEIALQELDRLLAENLLARGEIKLFHLRISDILRHYIEDRFGLQAPDRTTEEFLLELSLAKSSENGLLNRHKTLLSDFLTQCDLVKFAKHQPTMTESEKTVVICRDFIKKTKERSEG